MATIIRTDGLTKHYGAIVALDGLTLEVQGGEILGFLGPNGAGKTTTIRLLLDLLRPTAGRAWIGGVDCHRQSLLARGLVGYLPGEMPIYPELTGQAYLEYFARLGGRPVRAPALDKLLDRFEVGPSDLGRRLRDLSHGTKRKVGIIQALMAEPAVVILDEPTGGLDPLMIEAFAQTLDELRQDGRTTVFLSSHVLSEVERTCDRVALIRGGRLAAVQTVAEIQRAFPRRVSVDFFEEVARPVPDLPGLSLVTRDSRRWVLDVAGQTGPLIAALREFPIADMDVQRFSLEDYVLRLYSAPPEPAPPPPAAARAVVPRPDPDVRGVEDRRRRDPSSPLPTLIRRLVSRAAFLSLSAAGVMAGFQALLVLVATSFQQTRSFDLVSALMPMTLQRLLGAGALMLASFQGIVTFGYFHPIVVLAVLQVGAYVATEPAGEVEWGLFDLELARPVARHQVVTRSLVLAFGVTAALVAAMMLGTWGALAAFAPADARWPQAARVASLGVHLLLLAWAFAAAGLLAGTLARRRGAAFAAVAAAAVVLYMLNVVADAWSPLGRIAWLLPYRYFPGFAIASGTAPVLRDLGALAVPVTVLTLAAYWRFQRRDL